MKVAYDGTPFTGWTTVCGPPQSGLSPWWILAGVAAALLLLGGGKKKETPRAR
jgi:hypothetical protein